MGSFLKLFNLLCSSKILITLKYIKTLNNSNRIPELMRVAKKPKSTRETFYYQTPILTVSNRFLEAHVHILAGVLYNLHPTPAWAVNLTYERKPFYAAVNRTCERKPFHAAVNLTCERKPFHAAVNLTWERKPFHAAVNLTCERKPFTPP